MKKLIVLILALLLTLTLGGAALAQGALITDLAGLLTAEEVSRLEEEFRQTGDDIGFDIAVLTLNSLEGHNIEDYACTFYEEGDYGYGDTLDGSLLLVSMDEREWVIVGYGYGEDILTDSVLDYIGESMAEYLSSGEYARAFEQYAMLAAYYIGDAREKGIEPSGDYRKQDYYWDEGEQGMHTSVKPPFNWSRALIVSLVIGFIAALIATSVMKGKLRSVRSQAAASDYVKEGSLNLTDSRELFLYHTVSRVPRSQSNGTRSGGGGGGHSVHVSHSSSHGHF